MVKAQPSVAPLFVPASKPGRLPKAAASGADAIIVDLEDAVPPRDKDSAREGLRAIVPELPGAVFLRINGRASQWCDPDLALAASLPLAGIMLPKCESAADLDHVARQLGAAVPVLGLVETAAGLANLAGIAAAPNLLQIAFGSVDYALDLGCSHSRAALAHARGEIVMRSRAAGLPAPLDGVCTGFSDPEALRDDCAYAAELGFGGKMAIHPRQLAAIQAGFLPSAEELDWARRVLAGEAGADGAAFQLEGRMIDKPVIEKARRTLAKQPGGAPAA